MEPVKPVAKRESGVENPVLAAPRQGCRTNKQQFAETMVPLWL